MKTTLSDRLRQLRSHKGLSQADVAALAGVTQEAVQQVEAGKTRRPKWLFQVAERACVRPKWLINGDGPMVDPEIAKEASPQSSVIPPSQNEIDIQTYRVRAARRVSHAIPPESGEENMWTVPRDHIDGVYSGNIEDLVGIVVWDDSNAPRLYLGDKILVAVSDYEITDGFYVLDEPAAQTIARIERDPADPRMVDVRRLASPGLARALPLADVAPRIYGRVVCKLLRPEIL